jgi:hypothetical protein
MTGGGIGTPCGTHSVYLSMCEEERGVLLSISNEYRKEKFSVEIELLRRDLICTLESL